MATGVGERGYRERMRVVSVDPGEAARDSGDQRDEGPAEAHDGIQTERGARGDRADARERMNPGRSIQPTRAIRLRALAD